MCACEDEEGRMCMRGGRVWCVMKCGVGGCVTNGLEEINVLRVCVCVRVEVVHVWMAQN